jgi:hypothetical protein
VATRTPRPLDAASADAPPVLADRRLEDAWATSAHRRGGASCAWCHESEAAGCLLRPAMTVCRDCHEDQGRGFDGGKHGMRAAAGLAPMTPSLARRPMKADGGDRALGCGSCHDVNSVDLRPAAVEACLECHDDEHSRAYVASPHFRAWQAELAGAARPGSGVSCATCDLSRRARSDTDPAIAVEHNQNANLRPTTKMAGNVCGSCHGMGFSLDALADEALVARNFDVPPSRHLVTLEWVAERERARAARRALKRQRLDPRRRPHDPCRACGPLPRDRLGLGQAPRDGLAAQDGRRHRGCHRRRPRHVHA